ncbi:M56 family metallopeptidase [Paenibacillus senegalensis]|uniref:M56 family metallopeptidase n=1 Tax=Paenibacillus senegalensis TaxID=1465766 RepID=UPI000288419A|nr:M56 family metallopeptidase [Paenibacillus senegalensis]
MNKTTELVLSLSISGSILAVILLAVTLFIKHRVAKSILYCMWLVVLLRFVFPFSFEGSIMNDVFHTLTLQAGTDAHEPVRDVTDPNISPSTRQLDVNAVNQAALPYKLFRDILSYIWLLGALVSLTVQVIGYARFKKLIMRTSSAAALEDQKLITILLNGKSRVRLSRNRFISSPMLIGIVNPHIIIPDHRFNEKQLRHMLLHEIVHLKRLDIAIKWLTMIAVSVHWFNPLIYLVRREVNFTCELACDEKVINQLDPGEKRDYADTLLSIAAAHRYGGGLPQAMMVEEKMHLKERLVAIMNFNPKSWWVTLLSVGLLAAVVFGAVLLGASPGTTSAGPAELAESYRLSVPKDWSIEQLPGSSLSFKKNGAGVGGLNPLEYYPDQPISQLRNNHTHVVESSPLEGYFTDVLFEIQQQTPPAASGDTAVKETVHIYFIVRDRKIAYDLYFNAGVDRQTALDIAASFRLK